MNFAFRTKLRNSFCIVATILSSPAFGVDTSQRTPELYPNFYFQTSYAFSNTKSKLVTSNDSGTALRYGFGGFAGTSRNLEFSLGFQSDATAFTLNDSATKYDWQDTRVRYHFYYFYAGVVFSRLAVQIKNAGVDQVDAQGSGYGANLGTFVPVGKNHAFYLDVQSVSISETKDELASDLTVPSRLDIDLGGQVSLFGRWMDLTFGYRMRTLSHKMASSTADQITETYIGFRISR